MRKYEWPSFLVIFDFIWKVSSWLLPLVCVKWRVFLKQELILTKFHPPGNLNLRSGWFWETNWIMLTQMSEQKSNLIHLHFESSSQLKCISTYDFFRIVVFVLTTRKAPINIISCLFRCLIARYCKKAITTYHDCRQLHTVFLCVWTVHVELGKNNSCHCQLSYNLERNIVK